MITRGKSIELSMETPPVLIIEAGWCSVLHQSTENFTIGKLIDPAIASNAAGLLPRSLFSKALDKAMYPIKSKNKINIEVNRASQTHHVPHIGFPQIEPVKRVSKENKAPTGAIARDKISASGCLQTIKNNEQIASNKYENIESQALGT